MENNNTGYYITRFRAILALSITIGFFVVIGILFFIPIQGGNRELMYTSIGSLTSSLIMVLSHYFVDIKRFPLENYKKGGEYPIGKDDNVRDI